MIKTTILTEIKDSGFIRDKERNYRDLRLVFKRIDTEKQIDNYEISTRIEFNEDWETNTGKFYFKVHYSIHWYYQCYFSINRETKDYHQFSESQLFNYIDAKVYYDKGSKQKIKSRIKKILELIIKNDQFVYKDYRTTEKPNEFSYREFTDKAEKKLREAGISEN